MKKFKQQADAVMQKHAKELQAEDLEVTPIFSYDHAGQHDTEEVEEALEDVGISQDESCRCPLPPLSPDFHRVIERVHANVSRAFKKKLRGQNFSREVSQYKKIYKELFHSTIKAASIQADIRGLRELWTAVATPVSEGGTGGNWGPVGMT